MWLTDCFWSLFGSFMSSVQMWEFTYGGDIHMCQVLMCLRVLSHVGGAHMWRGLSHVEGRFTCGRWRGRGRYSHVEETFMCGRSSHVEGKFMCDISLEFSFSNIDDRRRKFIIKWSVSGFKSKLVNTLHGEGTNRTVIAQFSQLLGTPVNCYSVVYSPRRAFKDWSRYPHLTQVQISNCQCVELKRSSHPLGCQRFRV